MGVLSFAEVDKKPTFGVAKGWQEPGTRAKGRGDMQSLGGSRSEDSPGRTDGLRCKQLADQEAADSPAPPPAVS